MAAELVRVYFVARPAKVPFISCSFGLTLGYVWDYYVMLFILRISDYDPGTIDCYASPLKLILIFESIFCLTVTIPPWWNFISFLRAENPGDYYSAGSSLITKP